MAKLGLHLDADASFRQLERTLVDRGHDVTRTPCEWMPLDAGDEKQLLEATAHGRCVFTFNIADFVKLSEEHPKHQGIILAHQRQWNLSTLIAALDRVLNETRAEDWIGQVRWLNDWRK
jgi:hypothetical protein